MTDREKAIVMAYTGYTMLVGDKLDIFYDYIQEKLGRSVMTHELADEEIQDAIQDAAKEDFIALAKSDGELTPIEPDYNVNGTTCGNCGDLICWFDTYCSTCGRKIKWNNKENENGT